MAYFLIIPVFFCAVIAQLLALGAAAFFPQLALVRGYLWRILLWSSVGFLAANAAMIALAVVLLLASRGAGPSGEMGSSWTQNATGVTGIVLLIVGPIVASALGFGGGVCWGILRARRAKSASPPVTWADGPLT
jgi:hypothetical protein